jgi:hypothetical protein
MGKKVDFGNEVVKYGMVFGNVQGWPYHRFQILEFYK